MQLTKKNRTILSVFLLLYYIYMNSVRKVMIPMDTIVVPVMLAVVMGITLYDSKGKIVVKGTSDILQCASWSIIAVYIVVNNQAVFANLISKGMIQLFVMIVFMLCSPRERIWVKKWISYTEVFVSIHALATIIFFFDSSLYKLFVRIFYASSASTLLYYYNKGWMCGLSSHFSSNGMILAIGVAVFFEDIRNLKNQQITHRKRWWLYICAFATLYALILSSKRGPLIAITLSIIITYIFAQDKDVGKRLIILFAICVLLIVAYRVVLQSIPGMETIINKFNALEDSDAGILNGRSGLWSRALEMFNENPIFGGGFGSYATYAVQTGAITTSAHNYYLQVLAELGIVGLVLYAMAFISGICNAFRQLKVATQNKDDKSTIAWLSIALEVELFVIFYSMTSTAMMYYTILIPYFLACAAVRTISNTADFSGE